VERQASQWQKLGLILETEVRTATPPQTPLISSSLLKRSPLKILRQYSALPILPDMAFTRSP
jgi:hypothetical protein